MKAKEARSDNMTGVLSDDSNRRVAVSWIDTDLLITRMWKRGENTDASIVLFSEEVKKLSKFIAGRRKS